MAPQAALLLAIFAQLITVPALAGVNPLLRPWPSLLLAMAPVTGLAALAPPGLALVALIGATRNAVTGARPGWSRTVLRGITATSGEPARRDGM